MSKELDAIKHEIYPLLVKGNTKHAVFIAKVKLSLSLQEAQQWVETYSHESERTVGLIVEYMALHVKRNAHPDGDNERLMRKLWDGADAFQRKQIDIAYANLLLLERPE